MRNLLSAVVLAAAIVGASSVASAQVTTNVYTGHSGSGGGAPFSGLVGTLNTPDVQFGTSTSFNWHPFGEFDFGSDSTGSLSVAASGTYTFSLVSDDGSQAFIDSVLVVDDGGAHGPNASVGSVFLTAGVHSFEVQFFECCGGASGVDFNLPSGVTFTNGVPEPGVWALMLVGFAGLGAALRRRRPAIA